MKNAMYNKELSYAGRRGEQRASSTNYFAWMMNIVLGAMVLVLLWLQMEASSSSSATPTGSLKGGIMKPETITTLGNQGMPRNPSSMSLFAPAGPGKEYGGDGTNDDYDDRTVEDDEFRDDDNESQEWDDGNEMSEQGYGHAPSSPGRKSDDYFTTENGDDLDRENVGVFGDDISGDGSRDSNADDDMIGGDVGDDQRGLDVDYDDVLAGDGDSQEYDDIQ